MLDVAAPLVLMVLALAGATGFGTVLGYFLRGSIETRRGKQTGSAGRDYTRLRTEAYPRTPPVATTASDAMRSTPRPNAPASLTDRTTTVPGWDEPGGPTVLLVDDRPELLALHGACLHKHGYRVLVAEDGMTGLEYARTQQPGVIVLDHSMPGRTGIDVARDLKRDPKTAHIPVLLMTAHSYGAVGAAAREAGCDAFLPKPVDPSRLLREVVVHMRHGHGVT